jgi:hypothetical protein
VVNKGKRKPALLFVDHLIFTVMPAGKKEKARPEDEVSPKADKKAKVKSELHTEC